MQYGENGYDYPKQISIVNHQNQEKLELYWLQDKTGSGIRLSDSYYFSYFDINNGNLIGIPHNLILSQYDAPSVIMVGSKIDNSGSLIIYGYLWIARYAFFCTASNIFGISYSFPELMAMQFPTFREFRRIRDMGDSQIRFP